MADHYFMQAFLLQAIGWGIINSFWQSAIVWLLYKAITANNGKEPALFKYHLSLLCLAGSLSWFVLTVAAYYLSLKNNYEFSVGFILFNSNQLPAILNFLLPLFSTVYLGFICFYTLQFCNQYFIILPNRTKYLLKAPVALKLFTQQTALHIGIKKNVAIWLSKNIDVPSVSGYFKPVILFPFTLLNQLSIAQAEAILLHEIAHIKRDDYLINLFQIIAESILFFNPFANLLSRAAKQEREKCCDDWVLNYQYNKKDYAAALVVVEQNRSKQVTLALAATNGRKNLLYRIERIFTTKPVTYFNFYQQKKLIVARILIVAVLLLLQVTVQKPLIYQNAHTAKTFFPQYLYLNELPGKSEKKNAAKPKITQEFAQYFKNTKVKKFNSNPEKTTETYSKVYVNKDLLNPVIETDNTPISIVNNETLATQSIFVKVEEENSGSAEKVTYYLQLNKNNDQSELKPIVFIFNKQTKQPVKAGAKKKIFKKKIAI
jgi:beta-lactamase regulating signal transducer with metallopeptidase domain